MLGPETVAFPAALSRVLAESGRREPRSAARPATPRWTATRCGPPIWPAPRPSGRCVCASPSRWPRERAAARALGAGEAARILTGAPIPAGADSVVRQEDVAREGESVLVRVAPRLRENVRERGEDVRCGERVLEPGALIGPAEVGMLAALGRSRGGRAPAPARRDPLGRRRAGRARRRRQRRADRRVELVLDRGAVSRARRRARSSRHRARRSRGPRAPLPRRPARRRAGELGRRLGRRSRLRPPGAREARLHAGVLGREDQAGLPAVLRPLRDGRRTAGVRPARESGLGDADLRAVRAAGAAQADRPSGSGSARSCARRSPSASRRRPDGCTSCASRSSAAGTR